jgi:hypothetical protein
VLYLVFLLGGKMDEKELMSDEEFSTMAIEGGFAEIIGDLRARLLMAPTTVSGNLGVLDTAGGVLSWQNTTGHDCLVELAVYITTATGAATVDAGTAATSVSSNNLMTALSTAATGCFTSAKDPGASGKANQLCKKGEFVTVSRATGAMATLAGKYVITTTYLN